MLLNGLLLSVYYLLSQGFPIAKYQSLTPNNIMTEQTLDTPTAEELSNTADTTTYLAVFVKFTNQLVVYRQQGKDSIRVPIWNSNSPIEDRATLLEHGGYLYIAAYSSTLTGGRVICVNTTTKQIKWEQRLLALGSVMHSKYSNHINLEASEATLKIIGKESAGRYVELRQLGGGALIDHKVW